MKIDFTTVVYLEGLLKRARNGEIEGIATCVSDSEGLSASFLGDFQSNPKEAVKGLQEISSVILRQS